MVRPNKTERTERMFRMPGPDEEPDEVRLKREDDESQLEDALADYDGDEDPLP